MAPTNVIALPCYNTNTKPLLPNHCTLICLSLPGEWEKTSAKCSGWFLSYYQWFKVFTSNITWWRQRRHSCLFDRQWRPTVLAPSLKTLNNHFSPLSWKPTGATLLTTLTTIDDCFSPLTPTPTTVSALFDTDADDHFSPLWRRRPAATPTPRHFLTNADDSFSPLWKGDADKCFSPLSMTTACCSDDQRRRPLLDRRWPFQPSSIDTYDLFWQPFHPSVTADDGPCVTTTCRSDDRHRRQPIQPSWIVDNRFSRVWWGNCRRSVITDIYVAKDQGCCVNIEFRDDDDNESVAVQCSQEIYWLFVV